MSRVASQRSLALTTGFAVLALGSTAIAGNVYVVSPSGPYTQIQSAIDAASDFDTILVKPNPSQSTHYSGFTVNGKSLAIVGDPHSGMVVKVRGAMSIEALSAGGLVLVGNLEGVGGPYPGTAALRTVATAGSIRVEKCKLLGSFQPAASIGVDDDTQFIATDIAGGNGITSGGVWAQFQPHMGTAVHSLAGALRLFGCNVTGANGGTQSNPDPKIGLVYGGDGGHGLELEDGFVFAAGTSFKGGDGGAGSFAACELGRAADGGDGGDGIVVGPGLPPSRVTAHVSTLTCTMQGGLAGDGGPHLCPGIDGQPGVPVRVNRDGDWQPFANGQARYLSGIPLARETSSVWLEAKGVPGDRVYARIEVAHPTRAFPPGVSSHSPLGYEPKSRLVYLGTVPASGSLTSLVWSGYLPFGVDTEWWTFQSIFLLPSGVVAEGNDFVVAVIDGQL